MDRASMEYVKVVVRRLYDAQKLRIQSDLRMQRLIRDEIVLKENAEKTFKKAFELETQIEHEYEKIIWREIKGMPIIDRWLIRIRGIGPRLGGLLVANILDIERFATVSKLWAYCGLHVIDGKAAKRRKGEKCNWSQELKTTAWKIGQSFLKVGGPYRELYDTYRQYLITRELGNGSIIWKGDEKNREVAFAPKALAVKDLKPPKLPEWTLGRIHNMATRRTVKIFLSHLWQVWREIEGLPVGGPFVKERLGHESMIDPWKMIEVEATKVA
ncbi:hypothetical protein LCGC14_1327320 [marine sediment metagenome]|uniref:Transposase IS116/IS110/IS902 C-terminal domain-containing protein n=1 Tax=marine sediment metagenome TaxID=412755 RepID=A0A0F9L3I0_9ZZZZ